MSNFPLIESFSIVAPLGLCFHDTTTGERIFSGLKVTACPLNDSSAKNEKILIPNRNGVFVLQKIKGLEEFSRGNGSETFWNENPPDKVYLIKVSDRENRFQPFKFTLALPIKGIYEWENIPDSSPNGNLKSIPLYSSPTRKTTGGMSVVRAQLKDVSGVSASFAILEARFNGELIARGIADFDGKIVLIFPALAPQSNPIVSPTNSSTRITLAEQSWNLDLTVKYQPNVFQSSPPQTKIEKTEENLPDLKLVLAQAKGTLWANSGQTEEFTTAVLQTGRELVLRSRQSANTLPMSNSETVFSSFLYVSPAL